LSSYRGAGPLGGVERPRRMVRFARLIHRRSRAFRPAYGPRRLRRQSQSGLVATPSGAAEYRQRVGATVEPPCENHPQSQSIALSGCSVRSIPFAFHGCYAVPAELASLFRRAGGVR
jgi:hypothetical protein